MLLFAVEPVTLSEMRRTSKSPDASNHALESPWNFAQSSAKILFSAVVTELARLPHVHLISMTMMCASVVVDMETTSTFTPLVVKSAAMAAMSPLNEAPSAFRSETAISNSAPIAASSVATDAIAAGREAP
jgi:hypothetical protein